MKQGIAIACLAIIAAGVGIWGALHSRPTAIFRERPPADSVDATTAVVASVAAGSPGTRVTTPTSGALGGTDNTRIAIADRLAAWRELPPGLAKDEALISLLAEWAAHDPEAALAWVLENNRTDFAVNRLRWPLTQAVFGSWIEAAPAAAFTALFDETKPVNKFDRWRLAHALGAKWGAEDPQTALAAARARPADEDGRLQTLERAIIRAWASADPIAAKAWILANAASVDGGVLTEFVRSYAASAPVDALKIADTILDPEQKKRAVTLALQALAAVDLEAAWSRISMMSADTRNYHLSAIGRALGKTDLATVEGFINRAPEGTVAILRAIAAQSGGSSGNPELAWEVVRKYSEVLAASDDKAIAKTLAQLQPMVLYNLAGTNPEKVIALLPQLEKPADRQRLFVRAIRQRAAEDPAAAWELIIASEDSGDLVSNAARAGVLAEWALAGSADEALARIDAVADAETKAELSRDFFQEWSKKEPVRVAVMVEQLPPGPLRDELLARHLGSLAEVDLEQAQRAAMRVAPANRDQAVASVARRLAGVNPADAMAWYQANAGSAAPHVTGTILHNWVSEGDAAAAADWIRLQGYEHSQTMLTTYGNALGKADPQTALEWADSLPESARQAESAAVLPAVVEIAATDPAQAGELLTIYADGHHSAAMPGAVRSLVKSYYQTDPEAARRWVEQAPKTLRRDAARQLYYQWRRDDPQAAYAWHQAQSRNGKAVGRN